MHELFVARNVFVLQTVRRSTGSRKQGEKRSHRKLSENPSRRQFVYCVFGKEKFHKISDGVFGFRRIQQQQSVKFHTDSLPGDCHGIAVGDASQ